MNIRKNNLSNDKGFTLIELMVATLLIVVGLLAFGIFTGNMVAQDTKSERRTQAATYAQEQLENLKNQATSGTLATSNGTETLDGIYTRNWDVANGGINNLSTITVTVTWAGFGNTSLTFQSLVSQN
jgi:prepilin-type N-terminal cleavage/methylation domain-containing protein